MYADIVTPVFVPCPNCTHFHDMKIHEYGAGYYVRCSNCGQESCVESTIEDATEDWNKTAREFFSNPEWDAKYWPKENSKLPGEPLTRLEFIFDNLYYPVVIEDPEFLGWVKQIRQAAGENIDSVTPCEQSYADCIVEAIREEFAGYICELPPEQPSLVSSE